MQSSGVLGGKTVISLQHTAVLLTPRSESTFAVPGERRTEHRVLLVRFGCGLTPSPDRGRHPLRKEFLLRCADPNLCSKGLRCSSWQREDHVRSELDGSPLLCEAPRHATLL